MEPKARGALGSHQGPPVLVKVSKSFCRARRWDEELATGMATVMREPFHTRSHLLSRLSDQEPAVTGAGAGHRPPLHCQGVT